ncbi:hypothetical protein [Exiguobacterium artemiae]
MNIIHRMRQPNQRKLRLIESYEQLKLDFGRRPTYVEIGQLTAVPTGYKQEWGSYVGFLKEQGELTDEEIETYDANRELIEQVEKTVMNRSYKMVVLLAMLERGKERWMEPITTEEVAPFFYEYLHAEKYREMKDAQGKVFENGYNESKIVTLLKQQPFPKMGYPFETTENQKTLYIQHDLKTTNRIFMKWMTDIVHFRIESYFSS